jgi:hypothetical protein
MNIDALIGHTGFVGKTLCRQHRFVSHFNTSNIEAIDGRQFDTLVCAAAPGSMFSANREPDRDRSQIDALIERLDRVSARRFVLISSIAVLANFAGGDDEDTQAFQEHLAYGRHRRLLEVFCETRFSNCVVVRLPALFGPGLRKNFIFDLLNPVPSMLTRPRLDAMLEKSPVNMRDALIGLYEPDTFGMFTVDRAAINRHPYRIDLEAAVLASGMSSAQFHNPDTTYQYYDLSNLWFDIELATKFGLHHVHLATEPLHASEIYYRLLGSDMPKSDARIHREDMHTRHAAVWGRAGRYLEDACTVLDKLGAFFAAHRGVA